MVIRKENLQFNVGNLEVKGAPVSAIFLLELEMILLENYEAASELMTMKKMSSDQKYLLHRAIDSQTTVFNRLPVECKRTVYNRKRLWSDSRKLVPIDIFRQITPYSSSRKILAVLGFTFCARNVTICKSCVTIAKIAHVAAA